MMKLPIQLGLLTLAATLSTPSPAAIVTLSFEGVGDLATVDDFYNGGAGPNYGMQFSPETLSLIAVNVGGSGNMANLPSADTAILFLNQDAAFINSASGFTDGFSFWYSSQIEADVTVWDDIDGTGNLLGTISLAAQYKSLCPSNSNGMMCNWTNASTTFTGTAKSVNFGAAVNQVVFDDISFGRDRDTAPNGAVPEPATWAMMIGGFGAIGGSLRYRRRTVSVSFA